MVGRPYQDEGIAEGALDHHEVDGVLDVQGEVLGVDLGDLGEVLDEVLDDHQGAACQHLVEVGIPDQHLEGGHPSWDQDRGGQEVPVVLLVLEDLADARNHLVVPAPDALVEVEGVILYELVVEDRQAQVALDLDREVKLVLGVHWVVHH